MNVFRDTNVENGYVFIAWPLIRDKALENVSQKLSNRWTLRDRAGSARIVCSSLAESFRFGYEPFELAVLNERDCALLPATSLASTNAETFFQQFCNVPRNGAAHSRGPRDRHVARDSFYRESCNTHWHSQAGVARDYLRSGESARETYR